MLNTMAARLKPASGLQCARFDLEATPRQLHPAHAISHHSRLGLCTLLPWTVVLVIIGLLAEQAARASNSKPLGDVAIIRSRIARSWPGVELAGVLEDLRVVRSLHREASIAGNMAYQQRNVPHGHPNDLDHDEHPPTVAPTAAPIPRSPDPVQPPPALSGRNYMEDEEIYFVSDHEGKEASPSLASKDPGRGAKGIPVKDDIF